jgi:ABC-type nitrate/sulfonate/bicarbonate transport system substrate-binding protein
MRRGGLPAVVLAMVAGAVAAGPARAAEPAEVHVYMQPMARALTFLVGVEKGFFARRGLKVDVHFTRSSKEQMEGLESGKAQIVYSAVDNAVAMVEVHKKDTIIVSGGDSGTNELIVQDYVKDFSDIRGHAIAVDQTNTAYALQAKKILLKHGVRPGEYTLNPVGNGRRRLNSLQTDKNNVAAILNLPFSLEAEAAGMKSLGRTTDLLGPYQAAAAFTSRAWANANANTLEQFLAGFVESLRWTVNRTNKAEAVAILMARFKLQKPVAERTYDLMIEPGFGFTPDAKFNMEGFRTVLALRAEIEGGKPAAPEKYLDLSYYDQAMKLVK